MKEYEWEYIKILYDEIIKDNACLYCHRLDIPKAIYTLMKRIEELEEKLHSRIDTVHERINHIKGDYYD